MILKLIAIAFVLYFVYKLFGGKLPNFGLNTSNSKEQKKLDEDTLVECEKCSTFVTVKESLLIGNKYYCDECASKV
jgi:uncharacterized protein